MNPFHSKMQAQISQAQQNRGFLSDHTESTSELYDSSSRAPLPIDHSFAWSGFHDHANAQDVWFTHGQSFAGPVERRNRTCSLATRAFSSGRFSGSFHKAPPLPDSPMSYSATRSVLIPRPAALAVLLRLRRPAGLGFQRKISLRLRPLPPQHATTACRGPWLRARFFFGPSQKARPRHLGARHLTSLRAGVS